MDRRDVDDRSPHRVTAEGFNRKPAADDRGLEVDGEHRAKILRLDLLKSSRRADRGIVHPRAKRPVAGGCRAGSANEAVVLCYVPEQCHPTGAELLG